MPVGVEGGGGGGGGAAGQAVDVCSGGEKVLKVQHLQQMLEN